MSRMHRREFLNLSALAAGGALLAPRLTLANATHGKSRLVVVILRGALDGLAAVPPYGDPDYPRLRGDLALRAGGGAGGALPLDGYFGLHPALGFLHDSFTARELIVFHAVASPYRERSHFDGQDLLENGTLRAHAVQTGWLNRALEEIPGNAERETGVALGQNVPLLMRGPAAVTSWSPSKLAALDEDTLARITDLYASDKLLSVRLADALAADAIAAENKSATAMMGDAPMQSPAQPVQAVQGGARYAEVVHAAAGFLLPRRMDHRWRYSTPAAGTHTQTRAVPRDSWPGGSGSSMPGLPHSSSNSGRCGTTPRCWWLPSSDAPRGDQRHPWHRSRHGDGRVPGQVVRSPVGA